MIRELANGLVAQAGVDSDAWGIWLAILIRFTITATVFAGLMSLIVMFTIWWERKVAGHIQSRVGPMHVGGWHGWAQSLADGIKLLNKEDLMPRGSDAFLFKFAPYIGFAPVFAGFLALPFAPLWVFEMGLNIGVLYLLAVLGVEAMGVIMAGWGSNSKWAVYGAMREACQMVSYEIPLGLSIICGVVVAGTLSLTELSYLQGGGIWDWFVFHNPFMMLAFVLYYIASLASNKRAPFDLPESESELVAGFHTEYSGIRWSFFFFTEYAAMFIVGAIQVTLFMGGWNSPLGDGVRIAGQQWLGDPVYWLVGYDPVRAGQVYFSGALTAADTWGEKATLLGVGPVGLFIVNAYGASWFIAKAMLVIFTQIWLRWTLPRIRIDQVLHTCVKVLLPASLVALAGVCGWVWLVPQPSSALAAMADPTTGLLIPGGNPIVRLGHLAGDNSLPQTVTQAVLTLAALAAVGSFLWVILWAWINRDQMPRKTIYPDIMPVGTEIAFIPGKPADIAATPEPA